MDIRSLHNFTRRFLRETRGAVAVEAVFVVPVLILLGFGAADYSNLLINHHRMQVSLTSAGEYLSRTRAPQNFETQARNLAVNGRLSGGAPKLDGWSTSDISISYRYTNNDGGLYRGESTLTSVTVSSSLTYQGFGLVKAIIPGGVILRDSYETRVIGSAA